MTAALHLLMTWTHIGFAIVGACFYLWLASWMFTALGKLMTILVLLGGV